MSSQIRAKNVAPGYQFREENGERPPISRQPMQKHERRAVRRAFDIMDENLAGLKRFAFKSEARMCTSH